MNGRMDGWIEEGMNCERQALEGGKEGVERKREAGSSSLLSMCSWRVRVQGQRERHRKRVRVGDGRKVCCF